jgi:ATP-dependent DNA helicase UvrD/PcrA
MDWNAAQRVAIAHTTGPMLVLASAGSGKTGVLIERCAQLVEAGAAHPNELLAITFTNKAAREMRDRLRRRLNGVGAITIGTFHRVFSEILRAHAELVGRTESYSVYDTGDIRRIVARYLSDEEQSIIKAAEVVKVIDRAKDMLLGPEAFLMDDLDARLDMQLTPACRKIAAGVYVQLERELDRSDALGFSDLLLKAVELFRDHPDVLAGYRRRYRFISVDEYQDTNRVQDALLELLCAEPPPADAPPREWIAPRPAGQPALPPHSNLVVVGDPWQAIFRFRGSRLENIITFPDRWPGCQIVKLEVNYRSHSEITDLANRLLGGNPLGGERLAQTMASDRGAGGHVVMRVFADSHKEARWVAQQVARRKAAGQERKDIAVLYRRHFGVGATVELALAQAGQPYHVLGGVMSFYERPAVKAALAHLTLLVNPHDEEAFVRAVVDGRVGIGDVTAGKVAVRASARDINLLEACAEASEVNRLTRPQIANLTEFAQHMQALRATAGDRSISSLLAECVEIPGGLLAKLRAKGEDGRIAQIEELLDAVRGYEHHSEDPSIGDFLATAALAGGEVLSNLDTIDPDDCVVLSTVHGAKGGEWDTVLVVGLEDGVLPSYLAESPEDLDEERRIAYVAMTRAMRVLVLSHAQRRDRQRRQPSRFLVELEAAMPRASSPAAAAA